MVEARARAGLSQERVAELLGIDRSRLSGIERGSRPLDVEMLVRLAQLYGVTMGSLFGTGEFREEEMEVRLRTAVAEEVGQGEVRALLSAFNRMVTRYRRLAREAGLPSRQADILRLRADSQTHKFAVEGDAERLRDYWGLDDAPIGTGIFDLLEERGVGVYREALADTKISGAFLSGMEPQPLVLVNASDWPYRQVFPAAHELAHLVYHGASGVSFKGDDATEERTANSFASAFLMPASAIKRFLAVRPTREERLDIDAVIELHRAFGVSYAAMLVRLRNLGVLKPRQYEVLKLAQPVHEARKLGFAVQPWELGYEPAKVPADQRLAWLPRRFVALVKRAWQEHRLTSRQAAEFLNLEYEVFSALFRGTPAEEDRHLADVADAEFSVR